MAFMLLESLQDIVKRQDGPMSRGDCEPSAPLSHPGWCTVGGILNPGLPPHTPYLGTPVVFPPGQRPVSFF